MRVRHDRDGLCRAGLRRLLRRLRPRRSPASTRTPARSSGCAAGVMPIYEPGLEALVARNVRGGAAALHGRRPPRRSREADAVFIAVGTPVAARRRPRRPDLRLRRRRGDRAAARRLHGGGDQVDRAGRHRRRDRGDHPRAPARRRRSRWSPTRSSCARARRSRTSSGRTGWWWAWRTSGRGR